jgi:hypothetical protein
VGAVASLPPPARRHPVPHATQEEPSRSVIGIRCKPKGTLKKKKKNLGECLLDGMEHVVKELPVLCSLYIF